MPKFKVKVADDQGLMLYDEWMEAAQPKEACGKAMADAGTADVAKTGEQMVSGLVPPITMDVIAS